MRKIALLLALFPAFVMAQGTEWLAKAKNTGGGEIVLLVNQGSCPDKSYRMFSATAAGDVFWGCYFLSSTHVHAVFDDGRNMAYDFSGWTINPVYRRNKNQPL